MSKTKLKLENYQQPLNIPQTEEAVLAYWQENQIFEKSVSQRDENKPYVFYDGPPFATGMPHYGHLLASTIKDVIPRYFAMKGYRVERVWGWDCHGLPIENIVEKELKLPNKQAIEKYGIDNFNDACRATVMRYANDWKKVISRLGRFVDMEHDYKTMDPSYMESLWWVFQSLYNRGLIYQGYKSMHICPRCVTPLSNFEVSQGYKEIKDISVIAEFKLRGKDLGRISTCSDIRMLAWTTTPWTLPGNVLLALNPGATYVLVKGNREDVRYVCAKSRLDFVFGTDPHTIEMEFSAKDLAGLNYQPLFPYYQDTPNAFRTVLADFVTLEEGTGIVHIAPAFGEDDYQIGLAENIPLVQHVDMEGKFKSEVVDFASLPVKPKDNHVATDILIIKHLQKLDLLFSKINVTHTYPHCWRCETPLINYATNSWFVKVTTIKSELLTNNQKINWIPDHIKNGRFGKWLENARDWAISRNRYWGTPLPIWQAEDGSTICIGSIKELEDLSGRKISDLHKEVVDKITFEKDGKKYSRISEVLDCWFESGAMPYASVHYPFENKTKFEKSFPAEFISEGQDQTRGWFYTLHVLATALTHGDDPAIKVGGSTSSFKNCVCSGIVLAEDGKKMSKHLNNYPDPMLMADKYGVDSLRLYLMNSPVVRAENLNFSEKEVADIKRKTFNIWWNVMTFYTMYRGNSVVLVFPENPVEVMNKWLISRTETLTKGVTTDLDAYDVVSATRKLMDYVTELSTWYLRRSRESIKAGNPESLQTLGSALYRLSLLIAPITPFFSEMIFQNLVGDFSSESIHLEDWPTANSALIHDSLEKNMKQAQEIVSLIHADRKKANISLRQPLGSVSVFGKPFGKANLHQVILDETNVKKLTFMDSEGEKKVDVDLTITPELQAEGDARNLIRKIQQARKEAGVGVKDAIVVTLPDWPESFADTIKQKVLAVKLIKGSELSIAVTQK